MVSLSETGTILLVEDDYAISEMLTMILEDIGYAVIACSTGKQALNYLENNRVDALVCDIMLPEVDGLEVLQILRSTLRWNSLPIVLMTSGMLPDHPCLDIWTFSLAKPFDVDQLCSLIAINLQRSARLNIQSC